MTLARRALGISPTLVTRLAADLEAHRGKHTDTLLGAARGGAGISAIPVELAAPHLVSGRLVRVLSPWIAARFTLYAALPSRKFMPQRTRVFLDNLSLKKTALGADRTGRLRGLLNGSPPMLDPTNEANKSTRGCAFELRKH
ncbi:LysR substrate-binding domain-containing protein [Hydrogenophaga sp.]|uniref:LysR substrate-binding domain-containing protein n=1 Tax=Hydrogenophaga sp. TaxID=1904254 RepID=UPI00351EE653